MDVSILPLQKIFALDVQFRVPLYQRPYVWDRDRQWIPLWEDVATLAEHHLADDTHVTHHFLGAVVVRQQWNPVGTLEVRDVIDGQQRLTTLQLLADAVDEAIRENDGPMLESKKLKKITLNDTDLFAGDDQFKVLPTTADIDVFRLAMTDEDKVPRELVDKPIASAHAFFKSAAREWVQEASAEHTIAERFAALVKAISYGLHIVVINLEEDDNAQAIFETLNARGTPLLASDLVKNHLLNEAQAQDLDVPAIHATYWKKFEEDWWRAEITLGRISWPRLDAFLFYWLGMSLAREVSTQRLFDEYRLLLKEQDLQVHDVASSISTFGQVFRTLEESTFQDPIVQDFFYRWNVSQLRVLTPLLLWLFSERSRTSHADRSRSLQLLESWFMRRMICGRTTRGYQNFLHPLLREIKKHQGDQVPDIVEGVLLRADAMNTAWPSDQEVHESIRTRPLYRQLSRARLRLILEAVEDAIGESDSKSEVRCPKNLTIEHLLPVSWLDDDWPFTNTSVSREERRIRLHTLGNLTLVNEALNPAMSNSPWISKRAALAKHSNLHLNKMLSYSEAVPNGFSWSESWDDDAIHQRSDWLAGLICDVWPRQGG